MEEELKQLKSVLRSLVVSSATQVDVRTLLRDYRTMVGKHLPYAKYGCEPITFLKEHFSDCFLFQGPVTNPVLTLIVPDSLKHIDKFVQKQKVNNGKLKGKRRSVNEKTIKPVCNASNLIVKTFANRNTTMKAAPLFNNVKVELQNDKENVQTQSFLAPPSPVIETKEQSNTIKENGICSQNALQNFLKKRTPLFNSSLSVSDKESSKEDGDSGRLTSSSTSSKRIQIEQLHREIKEIIMEDPNGVWCTDLLRLYRARHNRELNYSRLGYTSVLSVVSALDGVHVSRRALADDWLLSDAARPPPARPSPRRAPRAAHRQPPTHADPDDALPGIDFEPDVFPADCVHFLESIPGVSLADVAPGDMLEVAVAEVYSPSHFWLLRLGEEYDIATEDTMDDMNEYYERGEGKDRRLAPGAVRPGHYCASLYDGDWHRSIIVRTLDADAVKTSECYLFPRFEALESGATPSFAEVHAYLRDGIALDFVHDYRRHVPPCLPPDEPESSPPSPPLPPPPPVTPPPRTVSLSATDCETFALLSRVNASAAQRFMLDALSRALPAGPSSVPGPSQVSGLWSAAGPSPVVGLWPDPEALEFRPASLQRPRVRPPPGFESDDGDGS